MEDPLDLLLADGVIDEVLGRLMSGKEASVHLVRRAGEVVAAKVYKDQHRSFKNNADYKEGRKTRNSRTQRAMEGGGRFGRAAAEQAWKATESETLNRLFTADVRVPRPVLFYEGVLLMELVCDEQGQPAPRLIDVSPAADVTRTLFLDLRAQMIRILCCDLIHGDLSPYNILAAARGLTIIDFPQVVSAAHSSRAEFFFQRDFQNVLQYFVHADPALASHAGDGRAIWRAYAQRELTPEFVPPPPSRRPPPPSRPRPSGPRAEPRRNDGRPEPRRTEERPPPRNFGPARPSSAPSPAAARGRRRPKRRW